MFIKTIIPRSTKEWDTKDIDLKMKEADKYIFMGGLKNHPGRGRECAIVCQFNDKDDPMVLIQYTEPFYWQELKTNNSQDVAWLSELIPVNKDSYTH